MRRIISTAATAVCIGGCSHQTMQRTKAETVPAMKASPAPTPEAETKANLEQPQKAPRSRARVLFYNKRFSSAPRLPYTLTVRVEPGSSLPMINGEPLRPLYTGSASVSARRLIPGPLYVSVAPWAQRRESDAYRLVWHDDVPCRGNLGGGGHRIGGHPGIYGYSGIIECKMVIDAPPGDDAVLVTEGDTPGSPDVERSALLHAKM